MTHAKILGQAFDALLQPDKFRDYGPNGLQVEGDREVKLLVSGVTASRALIEAAIAADADAILVHHGLFWRGQDGRITGWMRERLRLLLTHGIHLFAYHLPLDKHPELGNNAQLGKMLGWPSTRVVGDKGLIHMGDLPSPQPLKELVGRVCSVLGHHVQVEGNDDPERLVSTVAWCTGGAPGYVEEAALQGADLYLTGELSEPAVHVARECNVSLLGAGHHATERCGVKALGEWIAQRYGIEVIFRDLFVAV